MGLAHRSTPDKSCGLLCSSSRGMVQEVCAHKLQGLLVHGRAESLLFRYDYLMLATWKTGDWEAWGRTFHNGHRE